MRLVLISKGYYLNPECVQGVCETEDGEVRVLFNYGVSEAPSINSVSFGYTTSDFSLEETVKRLTKK